MEVFKIELEEKVSETIYPDGDHFRESIEGDTIEIEVSALSCQTSIDELKGEFGDGSKASREIDGQIVTNIDEKIDTSVSPNHFQGIK
ncbi:hypothetical protein HAX54_015307, partial [Datura stramonium]|nr:hypothetical protein [Datura stramonium]